MPEEVNIFLISVIKNQQTLFFSKDNPGSEIRLDVAHRMGKKTDKPMSIVVSLTTQQEKFLTSFPKKFKGTPYAISEQLPAP